MGGQPKYSPDAKQRLNAIKKNFDADVRAVAERLAAHEASETILVSHVDQAKDTLARIGYTRRRFYKRVEFEVGVGTLLAGVGFAIPSFAASWAPEWNTEIGRTTCVVGIAVGCIIAVHGWMRGSV